MFSATVLSRCPAASGAHPATDDDAARTDHHEVVFTTRDRFDADVPVKFTVAQIDALRAKLAALPQAPARPAHATTKMKVVAALASELTALRTRGWGLQALAAFLAEGGVKISAGTLKNYLQRTGATRKRRRKKDVTASSAAASVSPLGALPGVPWATSPVSPPVAVRTVEPAPQRYGGFVVREDSEL
jgi:hypothetical protein